MVGLGALLKSFIYLVSSSLLYPTLVLLTAIVVWILVLSGAILAEALGRSGLKPLAPGELASADLTGDLSSVFSYQVRSFVSDAARTLETAAQLRGELLESLLQEQTAKLWKSLDHVRMLVRIGPGLGLIGTLIPMGTGLAALGQGDITKLSSDLVIAFTTTVVGLAIGLTAYCFYWKKKRWVEEDIRRMEFIAEVLAVRYRVTFHQDENEPPQSRWGRDEGIGAALPPCSAGVEPPQRR